MIGSLFWFHVYYQTRRILKEISAALPQDASWNAFSDIYDRSTYERICKEFDVDVNADWRQKQSKTKGLGQYKITGQMMDTIRLAKEFNMTTRVILLLKPLQMKRYTSTSSVKV